LLLTTGYGRYFARLPVNGKLPSQSFACLSTGVAWGASPRTKLEQLLASHPAFYAAHHAIFTIHKYYFDSEKLNAALDDPAGFRRTAKRLFLSAVPPNTSYYRGFESALLDLTSMIRVEVSDQLDPLKWPGERDLISFVELQLIAAQGPCGSYLWKACANPSLFAGTFNDVNIAKPVIAASTLERTVKTGSGFGARLPVPGEFRICRHFHPRDQAELSQSFDFPIFKRDSQIETGLFKGERV
jgi:hypothetical protein